MSFLNLYRKATQFLVSEEGPTAVEYAIMLVVLISTMLSAIQILGPALNNTFNDTSNAVSLDEE